MSESTGVPIEIWEIDQIVPYDKNAKIHDDDQIESLAKSIQKFGWTQPIVVDADGVIIAGHGRRLAAQKLGLTKAPVVCRKDLSKPEADALRLADNRTSSTTYDTDLIQAELRALKDLEFDLTLTGFGESELDFMLSDLGDLDEESFVDDIGEAVEKQREENEEKVREIDDKELPIHEAFGFKKLRTTEIRRLKTFMAQIEGSTGKEGPEALMAYLDSLGVSA